VAAVVWLKPASVSEDSPDVDRLKGRYASAQTSKLKITVKPEPNELATFELR
jgi:hypothetical protein